MHNTQRQQQLTNNAATDNTVYRNLESLLDAMVEVGIRETAQPTAPAAPSALDAAIAEPTPTWSRGRKLTVSYEQTSRQRQDRDLCCQGGLFGAVDESEDEVKGLHGTQIPMDCVETDRGSGCCVCGDPGCGIGPFVRRKGGR